MWTMLLGLALAAEMAPQVGNAEPSQDKMLCKMQSETGSWVRKKKVCHTALEWDRMQLAARSRRMSDLVDGATKKPN